MERTSSRKTCQKAQPSVEENGLLNGYDDDDDDDVGTEFLSENWQFYNQLHRRVSIGVLT